MLKLLVIPTLLAAGVSFAKDSDKESAKATPLDISIKVTVAGFEPSNLEIPPETPVRLHVTRVTDATCAKDLVIPALKTSTPLPLNREVVISVPGLKAGQYNFGCAMSLMIGGVLMIK